MAWLGPGQLKRLPHGLCEFDRAFSTIGKPRVGSDQKTAFGTCLSQPREFVFRVVAKLVYRDHRGNSEHIAHSIEMRLQVRDTLFQCLHVGFPRLLVWHTAVHTERPQGRDQHHGIRP